MTKLDWSKAKKSGRSEPANPGGKRRRKVVSVDNWDDLEKIACGSDPVPTGRIVTEEEIEAGKSPRGAWTRATLAKWGVPWPPPAGWKAALIAGEPIPEVGEIIAPAPRESAPGSLEKKLLHDVVLAITSAGMGHLLADLPDVLDYFGGATPTVAEVIGGRPETALITGGITFDDKVWSFSVARMVGKAA